MQETLSTENLQSRIEELENRLAESEQLIEAIKAGEVDAFALSKNNQPEIYTLQSGDYAYRILVENFGEGALNLSEDGLVVYTNAYFYRLTGIPHGKALGKYVFDFIHPDSKERFNGLFKKGLAGQSYGEIKFLVNDKIIPVSVSLTSLYPTLCTVGMIVSDLTQRKRHEATILKYQQDLEKKNVELERTNEELASFTYIASHDLQEPLRKIQTFSSRILEKEYRNFPDPIKDYFKRIISASSRMQNLIISLLDYSRITDSKALFEPTDLNVLVNEVKNNLGEMIEQTHTIINSSPLPTLNAIPQQMNQLFTNLFANAIKYHKPGTDPVIKIGAGIAPAGEVQLNGNSLYKEYHKISISDNGIGFEQQYAEKIFELFQRLHDRKKYEGTGIGLAICKKIIQNHDGLIRAEAKVGEGAIFNIYLPVNE